MGAVDDNRHAFGEGENAVSVPRSPHTAWNCPSCGQASVGNVDQGCQNPDCTVYKLQHGVDLPAAPSTQGKLAESSLESTAAPQAMLREVYDVVETHGLWSNGVWNDAQGKVWNRAEQRLLLGIDKPPAEDEGLLPVFLTTIECRDTATEQTYTRVLTEEQTRTLVVALQLLAENVLVAGTPEGLVPKEVAENLARSLQP